MYLGLKVYTFKHNYMLACPFHGLACVTITSFNILAKYPNTIFAHFWKEGGGRANFFTQEIPMI